MKRYEKMSKEEIMKFVLDIVKVDCGKCTIYDYCHNESDGSVCSEAAIGYLNEEIEMKPRLATINCPGDLDKLWEEFLKDNSASCAGGFFVEWLKEKVEV